MELKVKKVLLTSDFVSSDDEHKESGNTDVVVVLENGKKYIASFFSYKYVNEITQKNVKSGEYMHGDYFWDKNMILVKECTLKTIEPVIQNLIEEGEFQEVFELL